jgi:hypothetical protein
LLHVKEVHCAAPVVPPELLLELEELPPPVVPPLVQPPDEDELEEEDDDEEEDDEEDEDEDDALLAGTTHQPVSLHTRPVTQTPGAAPQQPSPSSPQVAAPVPEPPVLPPDPVSPELALPALFPPLLPAAPLPPPVTTSVGGAWTTEIQRWEDASQLSPAPQPRIVQSETHCPWGQKSPCGQSRELLQLTKWPTRQVPSMQTLPREQSRSCTQEPPEPDGPHAARNRATPDAIANNLDELMARRSSPVDRRASSKPHATCPGLQPPVLIEYWVGTETRGAFNEWTVI